MRSDTPCIYAFYKYSDVDPEFVDYALKADSTKPMNELSSGHNAEKKEWYEFNNGSWDIHIKNRN